MYLLSLLFIILQEWCHKYKEKGVKIKKKQRTADPSIRRRKCDLYKNRKILKEDIDNNGIKMNFNKKQYMCKGQK